MYHQRGSTSSTKRETFFEKRYNQLPWGLGMTVQFEKAVLPSTKIVKYSDGIYTIRNAAA